MAVVSNQGVRLDFLYVQGTDLDLPFEMTTPGVAVEDPPLPVDLTDCFIRMAVRRKPFQDTDSFFIDGVIDADPTTGKFVIPLKPTLGDIPCGTSLEDSRSLYVHDIDMIDALGKKRQLFWGDLRVWRDL